MFSAMKLNHEIRTLVKSFKFAFRGLGFCLKNERNMRIHTVAVVLVSLFSFVYGLSAPQYAVLILTMALVLVAEMFNTAIEALVDLQTAAYADLARIGKDVAAGAVLVAAGAAVAVGLALFLHFPKLTDTLLKIGTTPSLLITFIIVLLVGIRFIFAGFEFFRIKKH